MKQIFTEIWDAAFPYQDKRNDEGHAEITLKYARKLVELDRGDEGIIVPAIILHDVGWSQIPREEIEVIFDLNAPKEKKLPAGNFIMLYLIFYVPQ